MKRNSMKKMLSLILSIVLIAAMALFATGCSDANTGDEPITLEDGKSYGEGATQFTLVVADPDGNKITATINTDQTTVGAALEELNVLEGEQGEWGLYIKTVNGITLDYATDGMYWAFYIDGEYAMNSVDLTDIIPGTTYSLEAEAG